MDGIDNLDRYKKSSNNRFPFQLLRANNIFETFHCNWLGSKGPQKRFLKGLRLVQLSNQKLKDFPL